MLFAVWLPARRYHMRPVGNRSGGFRSWRVECGADVAPVGAGLLRYADERFYIVGILPVGNHCSTNFPGPRLATGHAKAKEQLQPLCLAATGHVRIPLKRAGIEGNPHAVERMADVAGERGAIGVQQAGAAEALRVMQERVQRRLAAARNA